MFTHIVNKSVVMYDLHDFQRCDKAFVVNLCELNVFIINELQLIYIEILYLCKSIDNAKL